MPAFEYKALDAAGEEQKGTLEGDSDKQVRSLLREKGLLPLSVIPVLNKASKSKLTLFKSRVSPADLTLLTRQLATLVAAGLPLENALRAVAEQSEKSPTKSLMMEVRSGILEGHSLAESFRRFPQVFNDLYRATVAAGEQSGHLDLVLERLAYYTERRQYLRQKIQLALLYPAILTILSLLIVAGLLGYVVPSVIEVFHNTGQKLPLLTRLLIAMSDFVRVLGLPIFAACALGIFIFMRALKQVRFREQFHRFLLQVPFTAKVIKGIETARFSRTLSILNASGVPLLEALHITGDVISNLMIRYAVVKIAEHVREGTSLQSAMRESGYFPPMAVHMIASGETSGELGSMLDRVADNQDRDFENLVSVGLGLIGPLLVVMMGGIVLFIVLAILLPIFELNQLVT